MKRRSAIILLMALSNMLAFAGAQAESTAGAQSAEATLWSHAVDPETLNVMQSDVVEPYMAENPGVVVRRADGLL